MKKMKWMVLCTLLLLFISHIKANNPVAAQKVPAAVVVKVQTVERPVSLIEQIIFPHGI